MYSINFIFDRTFFLIILYQIFQNDVILMNHGSFFQGKDSLQRYRNQILTINQLLSNSAIFLDKTFVLETKF